MYDPAGNFSRVHNWGEDRNAGIRILADRHDEEDDNFADAFNLAFLRTGIVPMTGPLNMGANPIRAIAAGSVAAPSVTWELSPLTGIFQPNPDALAFGSNGVEKMRMTSAGMVIPVLVGDISITGTVTAGHVGISGALHCVGNAQFDADVTIAGKINNTLKVIDGLGIQITSPTNYSGNIRYTSTIGDWYTGMMGVVGWDRWSIYDNARAREVLSIMPSGNVNIGSINDYARLHVTGPDAGYIFGLSGDTKGIRFGTSATGSYIQGVDTTFSASFQPLAIGGLFTDIEAAGTRVIRVDSGGAALTGALLASGYIRSSDGAGGLAELRANGDVVAARAGGDTGVIFLNAANTRYLYNDGINYTLPTGGLIVGGSITAGTDLYITGGASITGALAVGTSITAGNNIQASMPASWPVVAVTNQAAGATWAMGPRAGSNNFSITLNATSILSVSTAAYVGVNTQNPACSLHVKANIQESLRLDGAFARGAGQNYLTFYDTTGRKGFIGYGSPTSDIMFITNELSGIAVSAVDFIDINGGGVQGIRSNISGNVSIGYGGDAGYRLYVRRDADGGPNLLRVDNTFTTVGSGSGFMFSGGSSGAHLTDYVRENGDGTSIHWLQHGAACPNYYNDCNYHSFRKIDGTPKLVSDADGNFAQYGSIFTIVAPIAAIIDMQGGGASIMKLHTAANIANIEAVGARPIMFSTNGAFRAEILGSGKFMVTGTVQEQFDVSVGATQLIRSASGFASPLALKVDVTGVAGTLASFYNVNGGNGQPRVGWIGTDGLSSTSYNTTSDGRLKENVQPCSDPGAIIDAVNIVSFDWKSGGSARFGTVAQDLFAVAPEGIHVGDNDNDEVTDPWGVDPSKYVFMLWREIQLLRERVAFLEGYGTVTK